MQEQAPDELRAAVPAAADDRRLEALLGHAAHNPRDTAADPAMLRCPLMVSHADEATAWLADKQRAMTDAIAPLVQINSCTENPEGGRKVGALLRELFAGGGVETLVRPSERFADHLVFRSRPELPNRGAVALIGHLDTVFPPGDFEGYRGATGRSRAAPACST